MANRALAVKLLKAAGHDVIEAADGEAGVGEALAKRPDLVLMDISLPGVDGWEALRRLRADGRTRDLRIVALTAHAMACLLYTSPSPRDLSTSRMPSSA